MGFFDSENKTRRAENRLRVKAQYKAGQEERKVERANLAAQRQTVKAEKQAAKTAALEVRGKELGHASLRYQGGFDTQRRSGGKLRFYENEVQYTSLGQVEKGLIIPASEITGIEITGQQQTNSRISVTRMATLGVFSLAAPKRSQTKEATVTLTLKDGRQVFFYTKFESEFDVHSKLATAISFYHSLQTKQATEQVAVVQAPPTDNAQEIMKYATLYKRGAITEEEYQAKKRQLLGL